MQDYRITKHAIEKIKKYVAGEIKNPEKTIRKILSKAVPVEVCRRYRFGALLNHGLRDVEYMENNGLIIIVFNQTVITVYPKKKSKGFKIVRRKDMPKGTPIPKPKHYRKLNTIAKNINEGMVGYGAEIVTDLKIKKKLQKKKIIIRKGGIVVFESDNNIEVENWLAEETGGQR